MDQPRNEYRQQNIWLIVLGIVMLLPGLCGAFFAGFGVFDHIRRATAQLADYEELVWIFAQPSVMLGCLGIFIVARSAHNVRYAQLAVYASVTALIFTLGIGAMFFASDIQRRGSISGVTLTMCGIFVLAFAIGGLPALVFALKQRGNRP